VIGLDPFQRQSRCVWRCPYRGVKSEEPLRYVCSLCKVGFHAECLAGLGAATPSQKELEDQRDGTGEWHCPVCSEANMDLWTCWMPLGDIPADPSYSRLMVLPGSHLLQGYTAQAEAKASKSRGRSNDTVSQEAPLLPREWTGDLRTGAVWHTPSQLQAGDIILFNIKLFRAANPNTSGQFGVSLDTRVIATQMWLKDDDITV